MKRIAIIGGGPAGSTTAEKLAWSGARVIVFEEKLGWEKPCGGALPRRALRRYPFLRDASEEHKCLRDAELVAASGASVRLHLRQPLIVFSRAVLNHLLLGRAENAGAEIIPDRILSFHRASSGLQAERSAWHLQGRKRSYAADYVVLAGGARSLLRALLTEPLSARDFMLTLGRYTPGVAHLLRVQFFEGFEGYAWAFPRSDHLSLGICGKVGQIQMRELRERLLRFTKDFGYPIDAGPVFSHLLPALSLTNWGNLRLAGPGWALAGDAAGLVDPVTGEGIYFAMRSGELLAESLLDHAPETYPARVWRDFGSKLALGARLAHDFYRGDFLGKLSSTRMIEFSARSASFLELLQDLLDGAQSYPGLAWRLHRTLGKSLVELVASSALQRLRAVRSQ